MFRQQAKPRVSREERKRRKAGARRREAGPCAFSAENDVWRGRENCERRRAIIRDDSVKKTLICAAS